MKREAAILCTGFLSIGVLAARIAGKAEPIIEQFRFDPPQLCLRDMFRWGFSYRGLPGGLAAVKEVELRVLVEGRPIRSLLTPMRDDLQRYIADQGRFESHRLHWPTKPPAGETEFRYTLRVVLADGHEVTSATSLRYVDACPPPAVHTTLAAGPTGRIGFQTTTPTIPEFLQGIRPASTSVIWGDLEVPPRPRGSP